MAQVAIPKQLSGALEAATDAYNHAHGAHVEALLKAQTKAQAMTKIALRDAKHELLRAEIACRNWLEAFS